eukprot:Opistho-2@21380
MHPLGVLYVCAVAALFLSVADGADSNGTSDAAYTGSSAANAVPEVTDVSPPARESWDDLPIFSKVHTAIRFKRRLDTCDEEDMSISESISRVIYASGGFNPSNGEPKRHTKQGSKSMRLVGPRVSRPLIPTDAFSVDLRANRMAVPYPQAVSAPRTSYMCYFREVPTDKKRHIVMVEPILQKENSRKVHHVLVYECDDVDESELDYAGACYDDAAPSTARCSFGRPVLAAWAVGGENFYYPAEAGYPIGGDVPQKRKHVLVEVHYDTPDMLPFEDSSGVRLWVTETLRPHDAGVLFTGHLVTPAMVIPARQSKFAVKAWCPSGCTDTLGASRDANVTVFATMLHSHVAGRAIELRTIRNGSELGVLTNEPHYDFNYQSFHVHNPPAILHPGDEFQLTCTYDTTARSGPTRGGLGTQNEMCLAYIAYYPRATLDGCVFGYSDGVQSLVSADTPGAIPVAFCIGNGSQTFAGDFRPFTQTPAPVPSCDHVPPPQDRTVPVLVDRREFSTDIYSGVAALDITEDAGVYSRDEIESAVTTNPNEVRIANLSASDFLLFWKEDASSGIVDVAVVAATDGWLAVGLSPNGGMPGSDVTMGWVDRVSGTLHVTDRHADGYFLPGVDALQDVFDVSGYTAMSQVEPGTGSSAYAWSTPSLTPVAVSSGPAEAASSAPVVPSAVPSPCIASDDGRYDYQYRLSEYITMRWKFVGDDAISVQLVHSDKGWVGIGISESGGMAPSDAVIGLLDGGGSVREYKITAMSGSGVNLDPVQTLTNASIRVDMTDGEPHTVVEFVRLLSHPGKREIVRGRTNRMIFACGEETFGMHEWFGTYRMDFDSCSVSGHGEEEEGSEGAKNAHGVLMFLAFGIAMPLGILSVIRLKPHPMDAPSDSVCLSYFVVRSKQPWFIIHALFQLFCLIFAIAGFALAFKIAGEREPVYNGVHGSLGVAVMSFLLFQPVNAALRPNPPAVGQTPSAVRRVWEMVHKNIGRLLFVLGSTNVFIGFRLLGLPTWCTVAFAMLFIAYVVAALMRLHATGRIPFISTGGGRSKTGGGAQRRMQSDEQYLALTKFDDNAMDD